MSETLTWIPTLIGGFTGGSITSILAQLAVQKYRVSALEKQEDKQRSEFSKQEERLRNDFEGLRVSLIGDVEKVRIQLVRDVESLQREIRDSTRELHEAITMFRVLAAESAVTDRVTMKTLESVSAKLDQHEIRLNEVQQSVGVCRELLKAQGITG